MFENTSQCRERQVREHAAPEFCSDRLLECRQLNFEMEPWFANAEGFRVKLPNGKLMEVQLRELDPKASFVNGPVVHLRPEMETILQTISTLHQMIDHE